MRDTIRPTEQLGQHHELTAPQIDVSRLVEAWSIRTRVGALYEAGLIQGSHVAACHRWRRDWDIGVEGVVEPALSDRIDESGGASALDHRVAAIARLREVRAAVGDFACWLLEAAVVRDWSWRETGRRMRVSDKTARKYTIEAIRALGDFYALRDRSGGKIA